MQQAALQSLSLDRKATCPLAEEPRPKWVPMSKPLPLRTPFSPHAQRIAKESRAAPSASLPPEAGRALYCSNEQVLFSVIWLLTATFAERKREASRDAQKEEVRTGGKGKEPLALSLLGPIVQVGPKRLTVRACALGFGCELAHCLGSFRPTQCTPHRTVPRRAPLPVLHPGELERHRRTRPAGPVHTVRSTTTGQLRVQSRCPSRVASLSLPESRRR